MALIETLIGPLAGLIDKIIPDPKAREAAKLELLRLERTQELELLRVQLSAIVAEAQASDPWTSRARPSFLYVMYALLLWSIPMGVIAAIRTSAGDEKNLLRTRLLELLDTLPANDPDALAARRNLATALY